MANDTVKLNGYILRGAWKALGTDDSKNLRRSLNERERYKKQKIEKGISKPQAWEFTDYPEEKLSQLIREHSKKKNRRVG